MEVGAAAYCGRADVGLRFLLPRFRFDGLTPALVPLRAAALAGRVFLREFVAKVPARLAEALLPVRTERRRIVQLWVQNESLGPQCRVKRRSPNLRGTYRHFIPW